MLRERQLGKEIADGANGRTARYNARDAFLMIDVEGAGREAEARGT